MQSSLSPGMVPASLGSHPLAPQPEWIDAPVGRSDWESRIDPDGPLAQALAAVEAKRTVTVQPTPPLSFPKPNHGLRAWMVEGNMARSVCSCLTEDGDTGWHLVDTTVANAATHQTLCEVERERLNSLKVANCETTGFPVVGGAA